MDSKTKTNSFFSKKKPMLSFEIFPPKTDTPVEDCERILEELCGMRPDFISVTFGAAGSAGDNKTARIAVLVKEKYHVEPVAHMTCANHSVNAIDTMLSEFRNAGIHNILALRGDRADNPPGAGARKADFRYASDLIRHIKRFGDFSVSGACYPENHPETPNLAVGISHLKEKVDAGAEHLISQLFFGNHDFHAFLRAARAAGIRVPIEAGIMPVTSKSQIERMAALCGASLPRDVVRMAEKHEFDRASLEDAGAEYAAEQIQDLLEHGVDGIHLYAMNNPSVVKKIYRQIKRFL